MKNILRRNTQSNVGRSHTRTELALPALSLMSPDAAGWGGSNLTNQPPRPTTWEEDLGLSDLVQALTYDRRYSSFIHQTLTTLVTDPVVIQWRQAVLADFLHNPTLITALQALLPSLASFRHGSAQLGQRKRGLLVETADRVAELELYLEIVEQLHAALSIAELHAPALITLRDQLQTLLAQPEFESLRAELPALREPLQNIQSLTIAINLDSQLRPASAVLLAVNSSQVGEPLSLLDRLIGSRISDDDESALAPLHHFPADADLRPMDALFQDVDRLMTTVAGPVARALGRYVRLSSKPLLAMEAELAFFVSAAGLIQHLTARGIHFCQPQLASPDQRITRIDGLINLALVLQSQIFPVTSPAELDDSGRIALLTGPNSGGKTTYLRGVGLAHVMAQAGLFLPAQQAIISPVDQILTHFPALETREQGRLAEEAERLRGLFTRATSHSLVLLNETFSSTAASEAQYLAQDVLSALCAIGVRAIFATHLTDLVKRITEIEAAVQSGSSIYSLVAGVHLSDDGQAVATYEIRRGNPHGRSYAQEIARRYGISLEQLLKQLNQSSYKGSP